MSTETFRVVALGGTGLQRQVGFQAQAVKIDNPTGQWWYVPTAAQFVQPYTVGIVVPLNPSTTNAEIQQQGPPGFVSAPLAGETATFTFSDQVSAPASGALVAALNPTGVPVMQGPLTDRSGRVTAGPVSTVIMAANATRRYAFVYNPTAAEGGAGTELWINFGVAAVVGSPSIPLAPGVPFTFEGTFVTNQAINIIGAAGGEAFIAKEG